MGHIIGIYHDFDSNKNSSRIERNHTCGQSKWDVGYDNQIMNYGYPRQPTWSDCSNEDFRNYYNTITSLYGRFCLKGLWNLQFLKAYHLKHRCCKKSLRKNATLNSWTLFSSQKGTCTTLRYLFVMKKVFNYSELHFSEVTPYKIHILISSCSIFFLAVC